MILCNECGFEKDGVLCSQIEHRGPTSECRPGCGHFYVDDGEVKLCIYCGSPSDER